MTIRFSTGARNGLAGSLGLQGMFNRFYMNIYSGAQPASADAAATGTLLGTVTLSSGALTKETRATGTITITGATGGTINNITVGGLNIIPDGAITVSGDTTSTLATKLADAINRNGIMEAVANAAVVTIRGRPGTGVTTAVVSGSLTTATASYANMGVVAGVAPVNGLVFDVPSLGVISKPASAIWSMSGAAIGTAGWFRMFGSDTADTGALLTAAPWYPRIDGTCGVGSGDAQLSSLSVSVGSPHTVDVCTFTFPAA
jgi:hypothetical protein